MTKFPYRSALVTGASSGIGASFARQLAALGVRLVVVARREDRLAELATELRREHGTEIEILAADLTDDKQLQLVEQRLTDPDHPIELLVNNAGAAAGGAFADLQIEGETAQVALNLVAPMRLTHTVLPAMIAAHAGGILFVSSMAGQLPMPGSATYGATKAALTSFAESLHLELAGTGVHVSTLSAGLTHTEFHQAAGLSTDTIPKMVPWMEAAEVAKEGLAAVAQGRVLVIPGRRNRMQAPMLKFAPRGALRKGQQKAYKRS